MLEEIIRCPDWNDDEAIVEYLKTCEEFRKSSEPNDYVPTEEEAKKIKKLCGLPQNWYDGMIIKKHPSGRLHVRSKPGWWACLMGREFIVDLELGIAQLLSEN